MLRQQRLQAEREQQEKARQEYLESLDNEKSQADSIPTYNHEHTQNLTRTYEERRLEILPIIDSDSIARDSAGNRWVKCLLCNKVDTTDNFISYGGDGNSINKGVCYDCQRKGNNK